MQLRVSNLAQAAEQAQGWATVVVSLYKPGDDLPDVGHMPHLLVDMADTEVATDLFAPTLDQVAEVMEFVIKKDNVVINCVGGISRSPALGIGLLVNDGMSIADAVALVHHQRPNFSPNKLILRHIDDYLNMGGLFIEQVNHRVALYPKDLQLWCDTCKDYFKDDQTHGCPGWN